MAPRVSGAAMARQVKELATTMLATTLGQTAGTLPGSPDAPTYAVVGFDGSASALRALGPAGAGAARPFPGHRHPL